MRRLRGWLWLVLAVAAFVPLRQALLERTAAPSAPLYPQRIVSLAPSITETLYALGLGPRIAGVTSFCAYPPEARTKPRVASFSEINLEAVLRARADVAVLPVDKAGAREQLERLGLPVLTLDTRSLDGLLRDIMALGAQTGHQAEAAAAVARFDAALRAARTRAAGKQPPRVLFVVMRACEGPGALTEVNVIGQDGFYSKLIAAAGGANAYAGKLAFPRLSREAILFLNPEVIIEVLSPLADARAARRDWESLRGVRAIQHNRLVLLTDPVHTVPGPRSHLTLATLSEAFHPAPPEGGRP